MPSPKQDLVRKPARTKAKAKAVGEKRAARDPEKGAVRVEDVVQREDEVQDENGDVLPLVSEFATVEKRKRRTGVVRVTRKTQSLETVIDELLRDETVEVVRKAIAAEVEEIPTITLQGDTIVVPVIEETVVVTKRIVLKEELHIRRTETKRPFRQTVTLRKQVATVERIQTNPVAPDTKSKAAKSDLMFWWLPSHLR
jgi:stress response protein YsnF